MTSARLIAAANILARHGQQQACEDVLATTRDTYKLYVADHAQREVPMANVPSWQQQQIAAAQPVTADRTPRSAPISCSAPRCATRRTRLSAASMTS